MGLLSMKMMVNGISRLCGYEKRCGVEKYLVENLHDYDLTNLTILWVGHTGVNLRLEELSWRRFMESKRPTRSFSPFSPWSGEGLRAFESGGRSVFINRENLECHCEEQATEARKARPRKSQA